MSFKFVQDSPSEKKIIARQRAKKTKKAKIELDIWDKKMEKSPCRNGHYGPHAADFKHHPADSVSDNRYFFCLS